jgi:oligopeptide/dipeptide ABC transporter ATP-binding protein
LSALLNIEDLSVTLRRGEKDIAVLERFNLAIAAGQMLALVGESGSGKTIAGLSVIRLLPKDAGLDGKIWFEGQDLVALDEAALRRVRGKTVGMVFQNPLSALNPSRTVGAQIGEAWRVHEGGSRKVARARALELLGEVGIANPAARLDDYPHQFSGGQRQRVMIAMALACNPRLLIADEPTTGLDPLIARQIMALIARLRRELNMGVLFVTHDLSVVEEHADAVHVLYAGRSVEFGAASAFFAAPRHPYSAALLGAVARLGQARLQNIPGQLPEPEARPPGCFFAPRCAFVQADCGVDYPPTAHLGGTSAACLYPLEPAVRLMQGAQETGMVPRFMRQLQVRQLTVRYAGKSPAVEDVNFELGRGECLGIVGESGSGKSTLARAVLQMLPYTGNVLLEGVDFANLRGAALRAQRRRIQVVFQDPAESMNPRMRIGEIIAEPIRLHAPLGTAQERAAVAALLQRVGLDPQLAAQFPGAVSGGQAQRIAIARALAARPDIIVLDEPASSLDVSTQAMLLNLLKDLASTEALSYILISHDFAAVSYMADRIAVLHEGRVVELGETAALIAAPRHSYTAALIAAAPQLRRSGLAEQK